MDEDVTSVDNLLTLCVTEDVAPVNFGYALHDVEELRECLRLVHINVVRSPYIKRGAYVGNQHLHLVMAMAVINVSAAHGCGASARAPSAGRCSYILQPLMTFNITLRYLMATPATISQKPTICVRCHHVM